MATGDLLLSIDCGTQSLRTLLFDTEGALVDMERLEYAPYRSPQPGWAERDPDSFLTALHTTARVLLTRNAALKKRIAAVAVTAQRDTMICLGADGRPLRPAITWLDTRKESGYYRPNPLERLAYAAIGKTDAIRKSMADGKVNWIKRNEPELWDRTWKYVQVSTFLIYHLTGEVSDSVASIVGHVPMDYRRRRWAGRHNLKSKLFPVEEEKLYPLVEPGMVIGTVTRTAAAASGFPAGIPVVAAGSDKSCETIGMGVIDGSMASLSFGTTATVEVATRRYFEPQRFMPAYCGAAPGIYNPEIEIFRGYWLIRWFKNEMGHRELMEAEHHGTVPEELMNRLLDATPPGNRGLMLQPFWGPGLMKPHARGAIVGFGDIHDRSSIYRAIVEGLAYELREGLETLERRGHLSVEQVAASGGAAQNDRICRITATILGRPLVRERTYETSGLGAALLAGVGAEIFGDVHEAIGAMVRHKEQFDPEPQHRSLYDDLYQIYRKIYPRMEPIYQHLQKITNYPEIEPE